MVDGGGAGGGIGAAVARADGEGYLSAFGPLLGRRLVIDLAVGGGRGKVLAPFVLGVGRTQFGSAPVDEREQDHRKQERNTMPHFKINRAIHGG